MASSSIFNELNGKFQFKSPGFFETNSPLTSKKYEKTNNTCDTPTSKPISSTNKYKNSFNSHSSIKSIQANHSSNNNNENFFKNNLHNTSLTNQEIFSSSSTAANKSSSKHKQQSSFSLGGNNNTPSNSKSRAKSSNWSKLKTRYVFFYFLKSVHFCLISFFFSYQYLYHSLIKLKLKNYKYNKINKLNKD